MSTETTYRIGSNIVFIMLLTLASYLAVSLFYNVLTGRMSSSLDSRSYVVRSVSWPVPQKRSYPLSHYHTIIDRNLFRTNKNEVKSGADTLLETLDSTNLELTLWGTITGSRSKSYAVIEESDGKRRRSGQELFHVGDSVQGATIKKILDEKVVLTLNGEDEILEMEEFGSHRRRVSRPSMAPRRYSTQNRTLLRSQIENAMSNIGTMMKQIHVAPHPDGIRISRVSPRSIFRRMGIRNGDVITSVDGRQIESVESALKIYDELLSSSQVSLKLNRRGREQVIHYRIQ